MSLDDRLRGAYRRQLDEVRRSVDRPIEIDAHRARSIANGRWLVAAGILVALVGAGFLFRSLTASPAGQVRADQAPADGGPAETAGDPPTLEVESTTTEPTPSSSTAPPTTQTTDPPTTQTSSPTTAPAATPGTGVANSVCPGGARAELEWAALRYVGENRGWGRKDDLVDEQDGPWYFEAWEPNHDQPVSVEIILDQPVLAEELRLAQDPFTPVGGIIEVEAGDQRFGIELSGTDGWRVHRFDEPVLVDRFTITRTARESNIMEVLLCVVGD